VNFEPIASIFRGMASANRADRDVIAQEIVEDLQAALAQFAEIASDLKAVTTPNLGDLFSKKPSSSVPRGSVVC
jgi:hypothetical protein